MGTDRAVLGTSEALGRFLDVEATRRGLQLGHDMHHDAGNWQLSWWVGGERHRLDFQVLRRECAVWHHRDRFPFPPRFWAWARRALPPYPDRARTRSERLASLAFPLEEGPISSLVSRARETAAAR